MDRVNSAFSLTCVLCVATAAVLMAVMVVFAGPLGILLGASGEGAHLLPDVRNYLIGLSFGVPGMLLTLCLQPIMLGFCYYGAEGRKG